MSHQLPLSGLNNQYGDSLQQFEQEHSMGKYGNAPVPNKQSGATSRGGNNHMSNGEISLKHNYANFYGVEGKADK